MTVDPFNRGKHHAAVVIGSLVLAAVLWVAGYPFRRIVGAVPWFLLFAVMVIGPATKLWPSISRRYGGNFPLNWRSELGIWFVIWGLLHLFVVFQAMGWDVLGFLTRMRAWAFAALIATLIAVILAITSNNRSYRYLGPKAWKWHQSHGTYVLFWLLAVHIYDQTFVRGGFPADDVLHWLYVTTIVVVVAMHVGAFVKVVSHYRKKGKYPGNIR